MTGRKRRATSLRQDSKRKVHLPFNSWQCTDCEVHAFERSRLPTNRFSCSHLSVGVVTTSLKRLRLCNSWPFRSLRTHKVSFRGCTTATSSIETQTRSKRARAYYNHKANAFGKSSSCSIFSNLHDNITYIMISKRRLSHSGADGNSIRSNRSCGAVRLWTACLLLWLATLTASSDVERLHQDSTIESPFSIVSNGEVPARPRKL